MIKAVDFKVEGQRERTRRLSLQILKRRMSNLVLQSQNSRSGPIASPVLRFANKGPSDSQDHEQSISPSLSPHKSPSRRSFSGDLSPNRVETPKSPSKRREFMASKGQDTSKSYFGMLDKDPNKSIYSLYGVSVHDKENKSMLESRQPLTQLEKMDLDSDTIVMKELFTVISKSSKEKRFEKAARHLKDAIYLRKPRHDIDLTDSKFVKLCYKIQSNHTWQNFLYLLSWVFMALAIFEPNYAGQNNFFDQNDDYFTILVCVESFCLAIFLLELGMEVVHRRNDKHQKFVHKYLKNYKMLCKIVIITLFLLDTIIFYSQLPYVEFRFSRVVRPFSLALYQKQLRRTFTGIIQSLREMIDVLLFFMLIILLYAVLGVRLIGGLQDETTDPLLNSFSDFGVSLNNIYLMLTRDNYPEVMLPSYHSSPFYLFYFIPFLLVAKLLLVPIPIAVMFEAFRNHRGKLVVKDRVKEREAIFACFISLDFEYNSKIDFKTFLEFFKFAYKSKRVVESKVKELYDLLDMDGNGHLTLKEFFTVIETLESNKQIMISELPENRLWNFIRRGFNKIFRFDQISQSKYFEYFMLIVVLFNTVLLVAYAFIDNQDTLDTLDNIDNILVYIYLAEVVIKIIGIGIIPYFSDGWNTFDFLLTIVSLTTTIALSFSKFTRTAKATRVLRNLRAQRALKLLRVIRGFKLCKVCMVSMLSFRRVNFLFQNIGTCFPIFIKLGVILFMVTYSYAILGMEIFPPEYQYKAHSHYAESYADFDNIGGALLILFQIINEAKWAEIALEYAERFDDVGKAAAFFDSYHALVNFIIISLLTGLILEVFTFMNQNQAENEKLDELIDEINELDTQIKIDVNTQKNKEAGRIELNRVPEDDNESDEIDSPARGLVRSQSYDTNQSKPKIGLPSLVQITVPNVSNVLSSLSHLTPASHPATTNTLKFDNVPQESQGSEKQVPPFQSEPVAEEAGESKISSGKEVDNPQITESKKMGCIIESIYECIPLSNRFAEDNPAIPKNSILEGMQLDKHKIPQTGGDKGKITDPEVTESSSDSSDSSDSSNSSEKEDLIESPRRPAEIQNKQQQKRTTILETRRYSDIHGSNLKNHLTELSKKHKKSSHSNTEDPYPKIHNLKLYKENEKRFFIKKITKCEVFTFERTQLSYVMDLDKEKDEKKNKLLEEKLYLKLVENENEDQQLIMGGEKNSNEKLKLYLDSKDKILQKIEAQKRKLFNNTNTSDRLIRKALLRGADIGSIEKYEDDQLREIFGQWFENMREKNVTSMLKVFEIENRCTIRIMRLMKQNHIISNDFVKILNLIEESINKNLLNKGSLGKFIFKDSQDRWFHFYQKGEKVRIGYLQHGFWDHFSDVFPDTNNLYEAADIFHTGNNFRFTSVVENLFISTKRIAKGVQNSEFDLCERNENVWNAFMIPFETDNPKQLRSSVLKNDHRSEGTSLPNLMKLLVTKGVFLSVNFAHKSSMTQTRARNKSLSPSRQNDKILSAVLPENEGISQVYDSPQRDPGPKSRSQSFILRGRRKSRLDTKILQGQPKTLDNLEEILNGPQVIENLPPSEYMDFLKDLRDILNYHKEFFFNKINLAYLAHPKNKKILA